MLILLEMFSYCRVQQENTASMCSRWVYHTALKVWERSSWKVGSPSWSSSSMWTWLCKWEARRRSHTEDLLTNYSQAEFDLFIICQSWHFTVVNFPKLFPLHCYNSVELSGTSQLFPSQCFAFSFDPRMERCVCLLWFQRWSTTSALSFLQWRHSHPRMPLWWRPYWSSTRLSWAPRRSGRTSGTVRDSCLTSHRRQSIITLIHGRKKVRGTFF